MENYIILEHIGEGSFGKVYKVWCPSSSVLKHVLTISYYMTGKAQKHWVLGRNEIHQQAWKERERHQELAPGDRHSAQAESREHHPDV